MMSSQAMQMQTVADSSQILDRPNTSIIGGGDTSIIEPNAVANTSLIDPGQFNSSFQDLNADVLPQNEMDPGQVMGNQSIIEAPNGMNNSIIDPGNTSIIDPAQVANTSLIEGNMNMLG